MYGIPWPSTPEGCLPCLRNDVALSIIITDRTDALTAAARICAFHLMHALIIGTTLRHTCLACRNQRLHAEASPMQVQLYALGIGYQHHPVSNSHQILLAKQSHVCVWHASMLEEIGVQDVQQCNPTR